jgi:ABC-type phosphate transport system ATPase subunit
LNLNWRVREGLLIVIVTPNVRQTSWICDQAGFSNLRATDKLSRGAELDATARIFFNPMGKTIEAYILGWRD